MNTLGAMLSGRTSPLDAAPARGPDPETAGADIFGAVLGALRGAEAWRTDDPDRPAGRHADATPEAAAPATPSEIVNPLVLLAAMVPARSDASPAAPRESLEALVARTLPAGIPAMDAGVALPTAPATPAGLPTPDARTRVTVLSRETHFAPVLPQILAAPTPPIPAGARDGLIPAPAPAAAPIPPLSPGPAPMGIVTPDLARAGTGDDLREAQTGPAVSVPHVSPEMDPSLALVEARAIPSAAVQAVPDPGPAPLRQAEGPAPTRVDPTAPTVPVDSRAVAAPEPSTPSVAAASPQPDARGSAMPRADTEDRPQAPLPASAGSGEARPPGGKPRASETVQGTDLPVQGETAPERVIPGAGAAPTRPTAPRPAQMAETVADPAIRVLASAGTPGPAAWDEAPTVGSDPHRTETETAPALPLGRASVAVTAPARPTPDSHFGAVRSGEAGSAKPAETAAPGSGGATISSIAAVPESASPGLGPTGAPPPAAPPPPAQQVAAAILGAVPRGATVATPGAGGLDGPLRILTLQLHPADLGTVLVRMRLRDGQLEMSLQASREETATLLAEGGDALADLLRQGGYQPERVTIVGAPPPAPTEAQAFQTRADAGPDQPPPDQSGRRQPEGRATPSSETQADNERNHASVTSSSERGGVYL